MASATHYGQCQVCGATQKLPGGRLSTHGYTVQYGFFSGTCHGTRKLPFEKSFDQLEISIQRVQQEIARNLAEIEVLKTDTTHVWLDIYIDYKRREMRVPREKLAHDQKSYDGGLTRHFFSYKHADGVRKVNFAEYTRIETLDAAIIHQNKVRIDRLNGQITRMNEYIDWQRARIANWVEKELTPIMK